MCLLYFIKALSYIHFQDANHKLRCCSPVPRCVDKVTDGSVTDLLAEATLWILHVMALFEQIALHHVF